MAVVHPLAVGDKITFLLLGGQVFRSTIKEVKRGPVFDGWLREEEGVTWIRGHHEDDSAEVQAMLAAYHLSRA